MIKIKQGLDLPINGAPEQKVYDATKVTHVALTGDDFNGMKPTMQVQVGDSVKKGQVVYECKKIPGVKYTSPAGGKVVEINRGEKRIFQTLVIEIADNEEEVSFNKFSATELEGIGYDKVSSQLIDAGLWQSFKTRPYNKAPAPGSKPYDIFVTAIDTNPLAANPEIIIAERLDAFNAGLDVISNLMENKLYTCVASDFSSALSSKANVQKFEGKHPAGNAGTHMHFLSPVSQNKTNWSVGYQNVIAIGELFLTGKLFTERYIALAGPQVQSPRLLKTRLGAKISQVTKDQLKSGENRIISGSVLNGRQADSVFDYIGFYHNQITVLEEGREREFLGWHSAGVDKFSVKNIYVSKLTPSKKFDFTTTNNGSDRAMVPIGMYEKVMPMDILPTQLLRALYCKDTDSAQALGALELDEEDLALCTFVDPGKVDYGPLLHENLIIIEKEG